MGYIYKITNDINNKVYIGQTIKTVQYRFKEHIRQAQNKYRNKQKMTHLQQAIIKYGEEHFHVETIEECEYYLLDDREIYWINYYDSYNNGYNMTTGGQIMPFNQGKPVLQYNLQGQYIQTFNSAYEASKILEINDASIRKACSTESYSNGYQWRYFTLNFPLQITPVDNYIIKQRRKVNQFNLKGELINTFDSIQEASRYTNINPSNISRACHTGGICKAGGYQWRFQNDNDIPINIEKTPKISKKPKTQLPVIQYSKEYDLIKEWDTIKEAAETLNIRSSSIINVCENKQNTTGGYYWRYKN